MNWPQFHFTRGPSQNDHLNCITNDDNTKESVNKLSFSYKSNRNHIFEIISRNFTISTNKMSYKFNIDLLRDSSASIREMILNNPNNFQYYLNINDKKNVLSKIEQLYLGKLVVFNEDELVTCQKITKLLQIVNCPNYMKPESMKSSETCYFNHNNGKELKLGVRIDGSSFCSYLKNGIHERFTIITKNREYKCNIFGINFSKVIRDIISADPNIERYEFDFDDEDGKFQMICDLFNFEEVEITKNNMELLRNMAESLQITCILDKIHNYIFCYETVSKIIDENQEIIEKINEVFDWLHNIKEKTVETVKNLIIMSDWVTTEESVQELAAFILQIIRSERILHKQIADLLIELDSAKNQFKHLEILLPFIITKLINGRESYSNDDQGFCYSSYYPFIYLLYKKGIIVKQDLMKMFKNKNTDNYTIEWFLPFLIEINPNNVNNIKNILKNWSVANDQMSEFSKFIESYLPDKIDLYDKMLDSGEPDDVITKILRNDDVDSLQSFISRHEINASKAIVPYNIYEDFVPNGKTKYINYAAAYGSIKCFKYMLLNHYEIDNDTFSCAVYGGNIEIIKIVDQQKSSFSTLNPLFGLMNSNNSNNNILSETRKITPAIEKHRYNLFDWILEQIILETENLKNPELISKLGIESAENGNAHSTLELVNINYDLLMNDKKIFQITSNYGYHSLTKLLVQIKESIEKESKVDEDNERFQCWSSLYAVSFGNVLIFKLFCHKMNQYQIEKALILAIIRKYKSIIKCIFEELINKNFQINSSIVPVALENSVQNRTDELFNYIHDQIAHIDPKLLEDVILYNNILQKACQYGNIGAVKTITDLILQLNPNENFTKAFIKAASSPSIEICQYFINKKVYINLDLSIFKLVDLASTTVEILSLIIDNLNHRVKISIFQFLSQAIEKKNKPLIEYLLKENAPCDDALLAAVDTHNTEIVDLVLKYKHSPAFVNRKNNNGTALNIAASNNDVSIVKRLLAVPGIDPNLYDQNYRSPLVNAIICGNDEIVTAILDFYGDNIQYQTHHVIEITRNFLKNLQQNNNNFTKLDKILEKLISYKCIDPNYCEPDSDTLLIWACKSGNINIVKILLEINNVDVNKYQISTGLTPLMLSIMLNKIDIAKLLINFPKTDINCRCFSDETALTLAVQMKNCEIIDLLIQNAKFSAEESRLDYAFAISNINEAKLLISHKDLNVNYDLDVYSECYIVDEYNKNQIFRGSALIRAVEQKNIEFIDLIIQHPSFDKYLSKIENAICISAQNNNMNIFTKLIDLIDNDVNILDDHELTPFIYAVCEQNVEILDYILNHPRFDSKKSKILTAFVYSYCFLLKSPYKKHYMDDQNPNQNQQSRYGFLLRQEEVIQQQRYMPQRQTLQQMIINQQPENQRLPQFVQHHQQIQNNHNVSFVQIMDQIYEFDRSHDKLIDFTKLLPSGESFFTVIKDSSVTEPPNVHGINEINDVLNYLLEKGVNPNKPDKYMTYPLEKAIRLYSLPFAQSLLDSNKIDFSIRIHDNATFLHLAAARQNGILEEFLNRNVIDINSQDQNGRTPLFFSCMYRQKGNIILLFQRDDLDFLHRDKNGKDANFYLLRDKMQEEKEQITDKNAYLQNLLENFGI